MAKRLRQFTRKEIAETSDPNVNPRFVIHNLVYDVTEFIDEHPGGEEVYKRATGGDATECFEDVRHSAEAQQLMQQFCVGELVPEDHRESPPRRPLLPTHPATTATTFSIFDDAWLSLIMFVGGALILYSFLFE